MKKPLFKTFSSAMVAALLLSGCNSGASSTNSGSTASVSEATAQSVSTTSNTPVLANNKTSIDLVYTNNTKFGFHCTAHKDVSSSSSNVSNSFSQDIGKNLDYLAFSTNFSTDTYGPLSCSNNLDKTNPWGFTITSPSAQVNTITLADDTLSGNSTKVSCTDPKTGTKISKYLTNAQNSIDCRAGTYKYNDGRANPTDQVFIDFDSSITPANPLPDIIANAPTIANNKTNIAIGIQNNVGSGETVTCAAHVSTSGPNGGSSSNSWKYTASGMYPDTYYYQDYSLDTFGTLNCANNTDSVNKWGLKINSAKAQTATLTMDKDTIANYTTQVSCLAPDGSKISQMLTTKDNSITCSAKNWLNTTSADTVGVVRADQVSIIMLPITAKPVPAPTAEPIAQYPLYPAGAGSYAVGSMVRASNGNEYRCLVASSCNYTSGNYYDPLNGSYASSAWELVNYAPYDSAKVYPTYPAGQSAYVEGDIVVASDGNQYRCVNTTTCRTASKEYVPVSGSYADLAWNQVTNAAPQVYPAGAGSYSKGDVVIGSDGKQYRCKDKSSCNYTLGNYYNPVGGSYASSAWTKID